MSKLISRVRDPESVLICFGKVPDWFGWMFPESDVYHGWTREAKEETEHGTDGYIITDDLSASGVEALVERYSFHVYSYRDVLEGALKFKVMDMNRYVQLLLRKLVDIVDPDDRKAFLNVRPDFKNGKPMVFDIKVGNLKAVFSIEVNRDKKELKVAVINPRTKKVARGSASLDGNEDYSIVDINNLAVGFSFMWKDLCKQAEGEEL